MKKLRLSIVLLVVITSLVMIDARLNLPEGIEPPSKILLTNNGLKGSSAELPQPVTHPDLTKSTLEANPALADYSIEKRTRSLELFEKFDLSNLTGMAAYKNILLPTTDDQLPLYIYELHSPVGQGRVNYLNLKLAMQTQLGDATALNETNTYGENSLFYNNEAEPGTGYLLTRIGDEMFAFKYSKVAEEPFQFVQRFMEALRK